MTQDEIPRIGPHDLGGLPGGQVDREEHDYAYWERMVDALVMLLFRKGFFGDAAQLRRGIEALDPEVYGKLSYYERWAASAADQCVERGLVTREELDRRAAEVRQRSKSA